jgi:phosphate starvation-inducible protein PhoH and related proteins
MVRNTKKTLTRRNDEKALREKTFRQLQKVQPRNENQQKYLDSIESKVVTLGLGPAGSGKTHLAVYEALLHHWAKEKKRMIITRPAVEAGEKLGFLPGDMADKLDPYMRPIYDSLFDLVGIQQTNEKIERGYIEVAPLAYMRGRAEPLDSAIPTPKGFKLMRDIKMGDYVYGYDGKPTLVTGVYPQGLKHMVDVVFDDGTVIRCSKDHLWKTRAPWQRARNLPFSIKTADEIQTTVKNRHGQKMHEVPVICSPVEMSEQEVPLDPYVLGCLLGDGTITSGSIHFCTADVEIIGLIGSRLPEGIEVKRNKSSKTGYDYYITRDAGGGSLKNSMKTALKELALWGCRSHEKRIPKPYLNNSVDVRLGVFRGLMDTDGCVMKHRSGRSRVEFYSVSKQLAEDVRFIVESFGGIARIRVKKKAKGDTHTSGFGHNYDCYAVNVVLPPALNPFLLERKASLFNPSPILRLVAAVRDVGQEECQCISVAAPDNLYLTGNFVVTHNTFNNCFIILDEAQNATIEQLKMVLTRIGSGCKMVIDGDPGQSDLPGHKKESGLVLLKNILKNTPNVGVVEFDNNDIVRDPVVIDIVKAFEAYENKDSG